jgi:hypothetical protein
MPESFPDFRLADLPEWASETLQGDYIEACEVALQRFRELTGRDPRHVSA